MRGGEARLGRNSEQIIGFYEGSWRQRRHLYKETKQTRLFAGFCRTPRRSGQVLPRQPYWSHMCLSRQDTFNWGTESKEHNISLPFWAFHYPERCWVRESWFPPSGCTRSTSHWGWPTKWQGLSALSSLRSRCWRHWGHGCHNEGRRPPGHLQKGTQELSGYIRQLQKPIHIKQPRGFCQQQVFTVIQISRNYTSGLLQIFYF